MVIIVDNGLDFSSNEFVAASNLLGISLKISPTKMPNQKGKIESLYRNQYRKHSHGKLIPAVAMSNSKGDAKWE